MYSSALAALVNLYRLLFRIIINKINHDKKRKEMDKLKILLPIIPMLIMPILCNIWLIILYPVFFIGSFFWSDKDFIKHIDKYVNSIANMENK